MMEVTFLGQLFFEVIVMKCICLVFIYLA